VIAVPRVWLDCLRCSADATWVALIALISVRDLERDHNLSQTLMGLGPTLLNQDVLAFNKSHLLETATERIAERLRSGARGVETSDHR
jgi:hypothetical protein